MNSANTIYNFVGKDAGEVVIQMIQTSQVSLYLLSITIEYTTSTTAQTYILNEAAEENTFSAGRANVTVNRTFNADAWNSLVLPYGLDEQQINDAFGEDAKIAQYKGTTTNSDGTYTLNFNQTERFIKANIPVFIYGANDLVNYVFKDVTVEAGTPSLTPAGAAYTYTGFYNKEQLNKGDWFISAGNKFYRANGTEYIKPTRAVFRPVNTAAAAKGLQIKVDNTVTVISNPQSAFSIPQSTKTYNLNGQEVGSSYRGIVISNGKKYVRR